MTHAPKQSSKHQKSATASDDVNARRLVLDLLLNSTDYPTRQFGAAAQKMGLAQNEKGLARQILSGVLRHCHTLDAIFLPYCKRRVTDPALLWTLRIGVFQLFFLSNIPAHAAVHATIQSARSVLHGRTGFANAILRTVQRQSKLEDPFNDEVARKRLTIGRRSWFFDKAIFSDPEGYPIDFWAETLSFPRPLVARWFEECGTEKAIARMRALNEVPPLWLRINRRRSNRDEVKAALIAEGIEVFEHSDANILRVQKPGRDPITLPGFAEGLWSVQDPTSFQCLQLAKPQAGQRVLDLCAAPGGKSFATAELTDGKAEIVACDISESRLARLQPEAERLGHEIQTHLLNPDGSGLPEGPFDLIILDVPCSNTGVLNKRLEARSRFHKDQMHRSTTTQNLIRKRIQKELLSSSAADGLPSVLWTTCSIEPEENQEMAQRIAKQTELELTEELCIEPDGFQAGGYAAMLKTK